MRARALLPILVLLLTTPALGAGSEADAARRRGLEAMARSDWSTAARELAAAADAFSLDGRVVELATTLEDLGTVQLSGLGDPVAALASFERAAAIAERPASAWLWAALAAEQAGRPALAKVYKQRALDVMAPGPIPSAAPEPAERNAPVGPPASAEPTSAAPPTPTVATPGSATAPPAAAAAPTPFTHFFGAPPAHAPAPIVTAPPSGAATEAPAPAAAPTPFGHFFGSQETPSPAPSPAAPSEPAPAPSAPAARPALSPALAPAVAPVPPQSAPPPVAAPPSVAPGSAFQHFFGPKPAAKPAIQPEKKEAEPPPTAPPAESTTHATPERGRAAG